MARGKNEATREPTVPKRGRRTAGTDAAQGGRAGRAAKAPSGGRATRAKAENAASSSADVAAENARKARKRSGAEEPQATGRVAQMMERTRKRPSETAEASERGEQTTTRARADAEGKLRQAADAMETAARTASRQASEAVEGSMAAGAEVPSGVQAVMGELEAHNRAVIEDMQSFLKQAANLRSPAALLRLQGEFWVRRTQEALRLNQRLFELWRDLAERSLRQGQGKR